MTARHCCLAKALGGLRAVLATGALVAALGAGAQLPPSPISPAPAARFEYDPAGNPSRSIQAPGLPAYNFSTTYTRDGLHRRRSIADARAGLTRLDYTGRDEPVQVLDPRNLATQYNRDGFGQPRQLSGPDTGLAHITYDAAGNLSTYLDSRGALASYGHDPLNRPTSVTHSGAGLDSIVMTWRYDETGPGFSNGIGRLTSISGPSTYARYSHDAQGRVLQQMQRTVTTVSPGGSTLVSVSPVTNEHTATYAYDLGGNITRLTLPSGRVVSYSYTAGLTNAINVSASASSAAIPLLSQIQWLPFATPGAWLWHTSSGAKAHDRAFDSAGRAVRYPLGPHLRDLRYDPADRITHYTHYVASSGAAAPALDQQFGYDELNRLTQWASATTTTAISYDANGNRTLININGVNGNYTPAADSNRMLQAPFPTRSFSHDAAGNTLKSNAGLATFDAAGRLSAFITSRSSTGYVYDALGRRVIKELHPGLGSGVAGPVGFGDPVAGLSTSLLIRKYLT